MSLTLQSKKKVGAPPPLHQLFINQPSVQLRDGNEIPLLGFGMPESYESLYINPRVDENILGTYELEGSTVKQPIHWALDVCLSTLTLNNVQI